MAPATPRARASRSRGSYPRTFRDRDRAHSAHLRWGVHALAIAGQDLARVQCALRIERGAQTLHHREIGRSEQLAHHGALLDADAVLAGDRSAHADAHAED